MMRSRVPVLVVVFAFLGMNWPQSTAYVGRADVEVVDACVYDRCKDCSLARKGQPSTVLPKYFPSSQQMLIRECGTKSPSHCIFQNHTLRHHESIQLENPCQGWFCDAQAGIVSIGGCAPHWIPDNCFEVDGNGTYPQCCPQLRCNKTEEAH